ncbi:hypothetical protein ZWY2020_040861 [Hordeum vulgare]|nr:hypothetical protein ZWY2020_040861 [Hordeum vulgare]
MPCRTADAHPRLIARHPGRSPGLAQRQRLQAGPHASPTAAELGSSPKTAYLSIDWAWIPRVFFFSIEFRKRVGV